MERQATGGLGLTNFEKFITIVCWWQPVVALISLFFGSAPQGLKRHAKWSVLTAATILVAAVVLGSIFAGLGALIAGDNGIAMRASISGIFGFLLFIVAFINTLAVILGRGPYFSSATDADARFK